MPARGNHRTGSGRDRVGDRVQEAVAGGNEAVQGQQPAAELGRQAWHGDGLDALGLDERHGGGNDARAG